MSIFEKATRQKLRYPYRGSVSTEDLWDLSVRNLDSIFKTLNSQKKTEQEESLLSTKTTEETELDLKISVIKHVVQVKQTEQAAAKSATENRQKKQKLLDIIARKQDESLEGKTIEELTAMVDSIG